MPPVIFLPNDEGKPRCAIPIPEGKQFTIGRSHAASLDVPKFEVSRLHCVIERKDSGWTICDKSSFGTKLNGDRLPKNEECVLNDGDKIVISVMPNSYVFCSNGIDCSNNCKDTPTEVLAVDDAGCKQLEDSIKKTRSGMEKLKTLHNKLNEQFHQQIHGLHEKFQEQSKTQTPDQVKFLKQKMEAEKEEIKEKYSKEVIELGKKLQASESEQENLRQQLEILFEERGRDTEAFRHLNEDVNQLKKEKETLGEVNAALENKIQEISNAIETEKQIKKEYMESVGDIMESELQCCICNEVFVKATTLNCSHTFCENCINSWLRNNNVCPMCRAVVTSRTRSLVVDTYIDKMVEKLSDEMKERRKTLLKEREEAAKSAPPPPPLMVTVPHQPLPDVIAVRTVSGIQTIRFPLPGNVRVIHNVDAAVRGGAPMIVRAQVLPQVLPQAAPANRSTHGRNVRPRLPNVTGPTVIDLTRTQNGRPNNHTNQRRHGRT